MRAFALAAVLPTALAIWNEKVCGGNGGCVVWGSIQGNHPWTCPDGSRLTMPIYIGDVQNAGAANAGTATKEEFPKTCYNGKYPAEGEKLVKHLTANGQTMYLWLSSDCKDGKPAQPGNCYSANPNPSTINFCAMFDKSGGQCTWNKDAGECERWGASTVRPECNYWKPGLQDLPDPYYQGKP